MSRTTLIISDTHLGRPGKATADMLRPVWQGVDELVINGDAAEVQIPWLRAGAVRELDRLDDLTRRDGVRLTLVSGNHDAYLTDRRCLELAGGEVLVMHGDALHPAVAPWTRSAKAMEKLTARALADADPDERDTLRTRLAVAQHVGHSEFLEEYVLSSRGEGGLWHAVRRPWEVPRVMAYWRREPGLAVRFIERYTPRTQVLILGHSHRAGVWRRGGRTIINTGAFTFPGRPWCAVVSDDTLRVERLVKTRTHYERSGETVHRAALPAQAHHDSTPQQLPCKTAIA
ncbi:MAG: metallophosphoesterase family protein [Phycisphaeraceae bacterium]